MATEETYLTKEGEDTLLRELIYLNEYARPVLVSQLKQGRDEGKLRKNADFDDARERLWALDGRIRRIETTLNSAIIVDTGTENMERALRQELMDLEEMRLPSLLEQRKSLAKDLDAMSIDPELDKQMKALREQRKKLQQELRELKEAQENDTENTMSEAQVGLNRIRIQRITDRLEELNEQLKTLTGGQREFKSKEKEHKNAVGEINSVEARIVHINTMLANIITIEDENALRNEVSELIEMRRPEFATKLKEAVAQGDLKENADYHDAKEQLGFIEGRIQQIQAILEVAIVVDSSEPSDEVRIGSTVTIQEDGEDIDEEYRIVGSAEANPRERKISAKSPIGAALLGKGIGKKVRVKTPDGVIKFKIVDIR